MRSGNNSRVRESEKAITERAAARLRLATLSADGATLTRLRLADAVRNTVTALNEIRCLRFDAIGYDGGKHMRLEK